ncbi:hypothetical protein NUW58_g9474 [Xylaria curta]|uniref:Uncharacterized protein n=1 Tax=Xylaria curta TaxID=42375 RepID=A0ACC1MWV9_9PEZI|nr:hypothetical protein NUW58_g9474 [Xylaria curta]
MSSENLNKIVRDTASRGVGFGTTGYVGTPSEQVGFQASDEYTSRMVTPQPSPGVPQAESVKSPLKPSFSESEGGNESNVIHVDEDGQYKGFTKYGDETSANGHGARDDDAWPILAADEVAKDPSPYELQPAVPPMRRGSDEARSRPSSRPASVYSPPPPEVHSTPLADVEEYEPLFPEDEKGGQKPKTSADKLKEYRQRFPSQDIWEDAPNSVHSTAEVSTPEPVDTRPKSRTAFADLPPRDTETPAQAFARRQEELAEKESVTPDSFLNRQQRPNSWAEHQPHLAKEIHSRPNMGQRFPSRDIWEDTPDSLQFTTTVSQPQSVGDSSSEEVAKPDASTNKPSVPIRPPKKQGSGDDSSSKPTIPSRPKPQVPARPAKPSSESKESEGAAKQKPAVPARPVGGKIAALQAGFMSDLNNRLKVGPHAPKKAAPATEEAPEEKEKAPLADARKGRARGPQRRAPTKSHSPGAGKDNSVPPPVSNGHPVLSFSMTRTLWSIDEEGTVTVDNFGPKNAGKPETTVKEIKLEEPEATEATKTIEEENKPVEVRVEDAEIVETKAEEASERKESEKTSGESEITTSDNQPIESQHTVEETKPLATNTAGESILTETVDKKEGSDEVDKVEGTKDEVIS